MKNKKTHIRILALLLAIALISGCSAAQEGNIELEFTFEDGTQGWTGGFADVPADYEEELYETVFEHSDLPGETGIDGSALKIGGRNASDDMFMFVKRQLTSDDGIEPGADYLVRVYLEFATNAPKEAVGIGGAPGESVFVKVGASGVEPVPEVDDPGSAHPYYRMNVDKGAQSDSGENAIVVGNAAKLSEGFNYDYEMKSLDNGDNPLEVTADEEGNLWIFAGTDSGFEGATLLYYDTIKVVLEKAE